MNINENQDLVCDTLESRRNFPREIHQIGKDILSFETAVPTKTGVLRELRATRPQT